MRPPSPLSRLIEWLIKPVLDFAALKLSDEARGYDPYGASFGDVPGTDDLKSTLFHTETNSRGGQRKNVA